MLKEHIMSKKNSRDTIVFVTDSLEAALALLDNLESKPKYNAEQPSTSVIRVINRVKAIIERFGGTLAPLGAIQDLQVHLIMQDPNYNLLSEKYNGDQSDPSNARFEASGSNGTLLRAGVICKLKQG
jgi:hypothetical protein